jgi:hypothetical protein
MKGQFVKHCCLMLLMVAGLGTYKLRAQTLHPKGTRILLVLDASYSMSQDWKNNNTKYQDAAEFILQLMDEAYKHDSTIEFALRAYGHQYPARYRMCYDSKHEVHFSRDNTQQMMMRLESMQPKGVASVSYSVRESVQNINFKDRYEYIMVIITDGGESCEGNFCESLDALKRYAPVTTHVLHLADAKEPRLSCANYYYLAADASVEHLAIQNILQKYNTPTKGQLQPVPAIERQTPTPARPQPQTEIPVAAPPPAPIQKPTPSAPAPEPPATPQPAQVPAPMPMPTPPPVPVPTPTPDSGKAVTATQAPAADLLGFGVLSLTGLDSVEIKDLQIENAGRYARYDRYNTSMQPQGPKMVHKLMPGNYKLLYRKGVVQIWQKHFTIKDGQITEVKL